MASPARNAPPRGITNAGGVCAPRPTYLILSLLKSGTRWLRDNLKAINR
jgi:hypothetical protein